MRTYPVTFLHDLTTTSRQEHWHTLTFASRGHLEVVADDTRRFVPADRAVWIPAGVEHTNVMRAPCSMRSLFVARRHGCRTTVPREVCTLAVSPLLRELVLEVTRLGALERAVSAQARLARVLLDQIASATRIALELPVPRDPRAKRLADLVSRHPGDERSLEQLARLAGGSVRTLERAFLAETGVSIGAWRRRVRLFHAHRLLEGGASVTEVALDVGYATASAFSQAFHRQFAQSPSRVRRSKAK